MGEPDFRAALKATGKTQIVLCGAEAHICVLQTALDLQATGYAVYWLSEATASRRKEEARLARERACAGGAVGVSADMVAYEWIERCDTATFKQAHQTFLKRRAARPLTFSSGRSNGRRRSDTVLFASSEHQRIALRCLGVKAIARDVKRL